VKLPSSKENDDCQEERPGDEYNAPNDDFYDFLSVVGHVPASRTCSSQLHRPPSAADLNRGLALRIVSNLYQCLTVVNGRGSIILVRNTAVICKEAGTMRFWKFGWLRKVLGAMFVAAGLFHLLMRIMVAMPLAKSFASPQWRMAIQLADAFIFVGVVFALVWIGVQNVLDVVRRGADTDTAVFKLIVAFLIGNGVYRLLANPNSSAVNGDPAITILSGLVLGLWLFLSD
jgi:hypothetical protein